MVKRERDLSSEEVEVEVEKVSSRVISDEDENLSISANENFCTALNISLRRFFANPHEAVEHELPAIIPNVNDMKAMMISIAPSNTSSFMEQPERILLTSLAVMNGIMHSMMTSRDT